jgi:hypothetical protein
MKKCAVMSIVIALVLVSIGFAAVTQDIGAGAGLYTQTSGSAQSSVQAMIQKAQQAGSVTQSFQAMYDIGANSGKKGTASASVDSLNCLDQNVGKYLTTQDAISQVSVGTQAVGNGTATASLAQFGSQTTSKSADMSAIMVMSISSVIPSGGCGPCSFGGGTASNCTTISVGESTTATNSGGCHTLPVCP